MGLHLILTFLKKTSTLKRTYDKFVIKAAATNVEIPVLQRDGLTISSKSRDVDGQD